MQESKLSDEDAVALQLQLPHTMVIHTPSTDSADLEYSAPSTAQPGKSGGVAFLIPTYLLGASFSSHVITPHYAIELTVPLCGYDLRILNVYFPPQKDKAHLTSIRDYLRAHPQPGLLVIAGDVNQARNLKLWDTCLAEFDLVDLTAQNSVLTHTFRGSKGWSALDTICISSSLLDDNGWTAALNAQHRLDLKDGHLPLSATFKPPGAAKRTDLLRYHRLPDDTFRQTSPAGQNLPTLAQHYLHAQQEHSPFAQLRALNAFYQAFATSFPRRPPVDPAYLLRRSSDSRKVSLRMPRATLISFNEKAKFPVALDQFQPSGPDHIMLPRRVRDDMLRVFNDWEALQRTLSTACSLQAGLAGQQASLKVWQRFRLLSPKATGSLNVIQDPSGNLCTHPQEIAQAVLAGREFWTESVPALSLAALENLLPELGPAQQGAPLDSVAPNLVHEGPPLARELPFPPCYRFQDAIAASGNTSPGLDGIPYAAYRTDVTLNSQILHNCLATICELTASRDPLPTPHQLFGLDTKGGGRHHSKSLEASQYAPGL